MEWVIESCDRRTDRDAEHSFATESAFISAAEDLLRNVWEGFVSATLPDSTIVRDERDTTTPAGKALFQMMGVFAEFERAMIQERVRAGLERARAQGKRLGRRRIDARKEAAIRADLREDKSGIMKLAAAHGVGGGTVQRIKAALAAKRRADLALSASAALGES